jgi:hypothetical protein
MYYELVVCESYGSKWVTLFEAPLAPIPQQVDLLAKVVHVCVGTAACPGTADFRPCTQHAKIYRFVVFFFERMLLFIIQNKNYSKKKIYL